MGGGLPKASERLQELKCASSPSLANAAAFASSGLVLDGSFVPLPVWKAGAGLQA